MREKKSMHTLPFTEETSLHSQASSGCTQMPDLPEAPAPKARPPGPGPPLGASAGTEGRKGGR